MQIVSIIITKRDIPVEVIEKSTPVVHMKKDIPAEAVVEAAVRTVH